MTSTRGFGEPNSSWANTVHDAGETTNLLGRVADSNEIPDGTPTGDDTWTGDEDFAGLPWWKRPSVCHRLKDPAGKQEPRLTQMQVWYLLVPYVIFTLAFGGSVVPRLNLYGTPIT
jgi:hypothetical protein